MCTDSRAIKNEAFGGTSPVVQWIGICLSMQGTWVSIPGLGKFHMPWCNQAGEAQLLSLFATTTEARMPRAFALQREKSPQ